MSDQKVLFKRVAPEETMHLMDTELMEQEFRGLTFLAVEVNTLADLDEVLENETLGPDETQDSDSKYLTRIHMLEEYLTKLSVIGFVFAGTLRQESDNYPGLILMKREISQAYAQTSSVSS
jgi:hypothetical protein